MCSAVEVKENSARIGWDITPRRRRAVLRNFMVKVYAGACEGSIVVIKVVAKLQQKDIYKTGASLLDEVKRTGESLKTTERL